MKPYDTVQCSNGGISRQGELDFNHMTSGSYLNAGSLPKKATNVKKEMTRIVIAMFLMSPILIKGETDSP